MDVNLVYKLSGRNGFLVNTNCFLCGVEFKGRSGFCPDCYADLALITTACSRCSVAMPVPGICAECLLGTHNYMFADSIAAASYSYPLDKIVQQFKYNGRIALAGPLGYLLEKRIKDLNADMPDCLIPVPLHITRQLYRGYNQSTEIARILSHQLHVPLDLRICKRIRQTRAQSCLGAKERKRNLKGSFLVSGKFIYQHVAIIDDVMTTGTTVNELAKILLKAGIKRISVWVCARSK